MSFRLPYDLVVMDMEMNQPSGRIIEIGAVKLLRDGGIHPSTFRMLVDPEERLDPEIAALTGISQDDLMGASSLRAVLPKFAEWAKTETKNILLSSWGSGDIACLRDECRRLGLSYPFRGKSFDAKTIVVWSTIMFGRKPPSGGEGLSSMLRIWDLSFEGTPHRALDDAKNTALLVQRVWRHKEDQDEKALKALAQLGVRGKK